MSNLSQIDKSINTALKYCTSLTHEIFRMTCPEIDTYASFSGNVVLQAKNVTL